MIFVFLHGCGENLAPSYCFVFLVNLTTKIHSQGFLTVNCHDTKFAMTHWQDADQSEFTEFIKQVWNQGRKQMSRLNGG